MPLNNIDMTRVVKETEKGKKYGTISISHLERKSQGT